MSWIKGTVCAKHRNGDGRTLSVTAYAVTERVLAVGGWGSSPPATQKTSAGADVFVWCIIFYNFPHCLPVKNRRVVVARYSWMPGWVVYSFMLMPVFSLVTHAQMLWLEPRARSITKQWS